VIPEEDEAQRDALAETGMLPEGERPSAPVENRVRRAWLGDAVLLRRAEAAEASTRALEAQLAERELELRRVKQREHAEQQLRVEAEEVAVRARRGHRAELDRWQRRLDAAHIATKRVEAQRDVLAAQLTSVRASTERLGESIHSLQGVAAELRASIAHEHADSRARIDELQARLERLRARPTAAPERPEAEAQRREEMASALATAVTRLRSRAVSLEQPPTPSPEPVAPELVSPVPSPEPVSPVQAADAATGRPAAPAAPPAVQAAPAAPTAVQAAPAAPSAVQAAPAAPKAGPAEVSTVIVVPRLFAGGGRSASRLAPVARRVAVRLARWADRAQGHPR
jgi:hypothetical protein